MSLAQISIDIDEADAVVLQENLANARTLTAQISNSLLKISDSTARSDKYLAPVVDKYKKLSIFKSNIDESLLAVSNVQGVASEASVYESKLNERITDVKHYITAIKKAEGILGHLKGSDGGEYKGISENLAKTINDSENKLKIHFRELILPDSQGFDPQIYMNDKKPFPYVSDEKLRNISLILSYFNATGKSIDPVLVSIRSKLISSSLAFLEPFTKLSKKNEKSPYEKGTNGIPNYTEAFLGFASNEHALLEDLFGDDEERIESNFQAVITPAVENYSRIIDSLLNSIQSSLANDGILVFEVIDSIVSVLSFLRSKSRATYPTLSTSLESARALARSLFKELLKTVDQKVNSLVTLPPDHGISDVTVDVMSKARKFAEFKDSAYATISGMKAGSWIPAPKPAWLSTFSSVSQTTVVNDDSPQELLSSFFSDVIDALIVGLEIKATQIIKKKQTIGFFLITNLALVEQIVSRSELKAVLGSTGDARLNKLQKRALNFFLTGWKQAAAYLLDVNVVGKLSSKDREVVKEKFRNFNSEFDDLVRSYKAYNITDPNLKKLLSKEISFIIPLYNRFYDKHSGGDFTKHLDKYIKFDKSEFSKILDSLSK